jgi:ribosome recycling factor
MVQDMVSAARPKMDAALAHFAEELKTIRTGRANAAMLDGIMVNAYGSMMPLKQVATVATPEPQQLFIQPFDAGLIPDIRTAIVQADMGFNPSDDGRSLRIIIPALTADRRDELVKKVGKMAEETRISLRNVRGDVWEHIQKAQKAAEISEDNRDWGRDEIDKVTAEYNKKVEEEVKAKEAEIRTI